jgi:anti-sigma factor RsiW
MKIDPHERARFLIDETLVAGVSSRISPDDELWLRGHIEECAQCVRYAKGGAMAVRALHSISFDVDPEMNARVQRAMIARAESRRGQTEPRWRWALAAAAILLLVVPIHRNATEAARLAEADRAAAVLLDGVDSRVSRSVPLAMEPLSIAGSGETQ